MLAEAKELCARAGWRNATLKPCGATRRAAPVPVEGVTFSLPCAVIPHHRRAPPHAREQLRPGGYPVVMDAKLPSDFFGKPLHPSVIRASGSADSGMPDIRPCDETGGMKNRKARARRIVVARRTKST